MTKLHEQQSIHLCLAGPPHTVSFECLDYDIKLTPSGVSVKSDLVEYFYPVANIVQCKTTTTKLDDEGHRCHNREGGPDA